MCIYLVAKINKSNSVNRTVLYHSQTDYWDDFVTWRYMSPLNSEGYRILSLILLMPTYNTSSMLIVEHRWS